VGHRGAAAHAPENTLASIRRAHELGADWVEFDVKLTRDGVPILMHDSKLKRTTNGTGLVAALDYASVARLDAGAWFPGGFVGERVPTLEAAVELLVELDLAANVEIKPCPGREVETGEVVAEALDRLWPEDGPALLVSSFARSALRAAHAVAPGLPLGLLSELLPEDWPEALRDLDCTTLHLWHAPLRLEKLRAVIDQGVPVLLYTVNDPKRAADLLANGASSIITDAPDRILPIAGLNNGAEGRPAGPAP
jgi:glycerophosphoryl diester phosphodiesterase